MEWEIALSRQAEKFLAKNHLPDEFVIAPVEKALRKFFGASEPVSVVCAHPFDRTSWPRYTESETEPNL